MCIVTLDCLLFLNAYLHHTCTILNLITDNYNLNRDSLNYIAIMMDIYVHPNRVF